MNNPETKMQDKRIFLTVDIEQWVLGTIRKVQQGAEWNTAWPEQYRELGGTSNESGKKVCPMKGAQTLYELGRIKKSGKQRIDPPLHTVLNDYSKNGVYAVLALHELQSNPGTRKSKSKLWESVKKRVRSELDEEPAASEQGAVTVAFKLWHLEQIV